MPLTSPSSISGPINLRTSISTNALPKITFNGSTYASSGNPGELSSRTPEYFDNGATYEASSQLYLTNKFNAGGSPVATTSGFLPDFYIAKNYEIGLNWGYTAAGSINFNALSGATVDKYEVFYLKCSQSAFLTAAGGGATANAITGATLSHEIVNGTQTVTGNQIYYRYIGRINVNA
jgi:hypothetical protein